VQFRQRGRPRGGVAALGGEGAPSALARRHSVGRRLRLGQGTRKGPQGGRSEHGSEHRHDASSFFSLKRQTGWVGETEQKSSKVKRNKQQQRVSYVEIEVFDSNSRTLCNVPTAEWIEYDEWSSTEDCVLVAWLVGWPTMSAKQQHITHRRRNREGQRYATTVFSPSRRRFVGRCWFPCICAR